MNTLLLTFDVEHFSVYKGPFQDNKAYFDISKQGLERIHSLLKDIGIPATLFLEYVFAERYPRLLNKFLDLDCEFALHCYSHDQKYATLPASFSKKMLGTAKKELEKLFSVTIHGFRGPGMSRPSYSVLRDIGIQYDSSLHPAFVPGYYNNLFATRKIHAVDGIIEIPISVIPFIRLPLSWLWFRNFGLAYTKLGTRLNLLTSDYHNTYFHPWDFEDFTTLPFEYPLKTFIARNSGDHAYRMLRSYINWALQSGLTPSTIHDYLTKKKIL